MEVEIDWKTNGEDSAFASAQSLYNQRNNGLTKREFLAAMAMQGLCANQDLIGVDEHEISELAVKQADSLLQKLSGIK